MNAPRASWFRRLLFSLGLLLLGSLVALALAELLVRAVAPQQLILLRPDIWQPMDSVGWAHRPNIRTEVNTGDRTVHMVTDSQGFRTGVSGRPDSGLRVLLLGDSFMAAMQVEYEASLAGLIERCFAARTGRAAAVWNTGVSGWDPPQYAFQARHALERDTFDLVLVSVFLGNDVVTRRYVFPPREADERHVLRLPRRLDWHEFIDAVLAPVNDGLETRSHLFVLLKTRLRTLLMRFGLTAIEVPSELRKSEAEAPRWSLTADLLAEIDSMAASRGIPSVFALIPSIETVVPSVLSERVEAFGIDSASIDIEQPERLMRGELERRGLSVVSTLQPLRAAQGRGVVLYGRADPHPSAAGHQVMWNAVAPALAAALHLPYDAEAPEDPDCALP